MSITLFIILITTITSIICFNNSDFFYKLSLRPSLMSDSANYHRIITHAFLHADWIHLLLNMFVFWSFGSAVESVFDEIYGTKSSIYYVFLYFGAIPFSALPSLVKFKKDYSYNSVGASGAVSAIVFAAIVINPLGKIYLFLFPIGIPAFVFAIMYLAYSAWMANRAQDNIDHLAHFAGAIYGILFMFITEPLFVKYFFQQIQNFFK